MSFNAKDMTQGGQIASMRIRMFSQIANIMLYCLFIFFWILVGLVLWVKISWQTFVNGCIYWWCTTLEGMRDLIKSQPVYEIQYYGKTFRMNAAQVLHDKYMIWCGEQLWSAFVLATVVALVICLITFFVVSWILGRQGKQQSENEITGGRQLTDNPKEVARMLKKDGKDSDSGRDVRLYSSLDETRTAEKLARHPSFTVVSEQIKARAGETLLETAISLQKTGLHTPAQQAIHLALPVVESKNLAFSMVDLLTEAKSFAAEGTSFTELGGEINAQIKRGDLLYVDVAKGYGTGLLVSRASYEAEKSILRHILEGKEAVTPLMERVPGELMEKLTSGQRAATRMILETSDRFTVVQGYAGVGKTTQFRAVMSAVNMLPESERPRVVGLGPTHRAVGEMRSAGVDAQTLASFLHDTQLLQRSGETPNFSNTLFLLDESSMVGNTDMARAYALIAAGGGRAVASGDTDQLQAIAPGQPFRLQQTRSAADVAIMKEIVRQTPELREAVYSLINRDVERALSGLESVKPSQVPRQEGAWVPEHSVTEFSHSQEAKLAEAQQKAMLKGEAFPDIPMTLYEAIVRDYTGRTPEAREQTLIVTHLNEDRRVLNSMIHDAREKAGELGKEQVMVPVLNTANIRDGELRRLSTWETHRDALALVDNVYHRIACISKDDGLIT
ncbi:TPA: TraD N-terminal domain-containing protein, partial [Escherichia coli]